MTNTDVSLGKMMADYMFEKQGCEVLHLKDIGFAVYQLNDDHLHINNIYVVPDSRRKDTGTKIYEELKVIAKNKGFDMITGAVDLNQDNADVSLASVSSRMKPIPVNYTVQFYERLD